MNHSHEQPQPIRRTGGRRAARMRRKAGIQPIGGAIARLYRALATNRFTRVPWAVIQTFSDGEGTLLSGSMAYFTFLSLLPLLMLGAFIIGSLSYVDTGIRTALDVAVARVFPQGGEILDQLIRARVAFGISGFVAVTYASIGFVGALTGALNRMWGLPSSQRNPVGQKLLNVLVVVLLAVVLLGSVGLTIWARYLAESVLGREAGPFIALINFVATPLSLFLVLLMLYHLLPAQRLPWRSQAPGAAFGALGVLALKFAFGLWARHSAGVSALPRSLLSVVLLLVWLGLFSQVILYGAALNVVRDRKRRRLPILPQA